MLERWEDANGAHQMKMMYKTQNPRQDELEMGVNSPMFQA